LKQPSMDRLRPSFDPPENWRNRKETAWLGSPAWKALRLRILERDGHACRFCGHTARKRMVVDHIDGDPNNHSDENLQIVCLWCNYIKHAGCVIEGVVDLYAESTLDQVGVIRKTRLLRGQGVSDDKILTELGLSKKVPFKEDHDYLSRLVGFITSRAGRRSGIIVGKISVQTADGRFLPMHSDHS